MAAPGALASVDLAGCQQPTLDKCTWSRGLEDARYRLGVDIGGTFTDILVMDEQTGATFVLKTPSTPGSVEGVIDGIRELERRYGIKGREIGYFSHGTTIGVNTLLQRSGAQVGALATRGFRDLSSYAACGSHAPTTISSTDRWRSCHGG